MDYDRTETMQEHSIRIRTLHFSLKTLEFEGRLPPRRARCGVWMPTGFRQPPREKATVLERWSSGQWLRIVAEVFLYATPPRIGSTTEVICEAMKSHSGYRHLRVDWVGESAIGEVRSITLCGIENEDSGTEQTLCPDCAQVRDALNVCGLGPESLRELFDTLRVIDPSEVNATMSSSPLSTGCAWFNEQRLLGPIGDIPSAEFEQMYYQQQQSRLDEAGLN